MLSEKKPANTLKIQPGSQKRRSLEEVKTEDLHIEVYGPDKSQQQQNALLRISLSGIKGLRIFIIKATKTGLYYHVQGELTWKTAITVAAAIGGGAILLFLKHLLGG